MFPLDAFWPSMLPSLPLARKWTLLEKENIMWKPGATAVPTRCLFWVATLALLGGMFLGSGDAQPEKPALKDPAGTRKLLGAKEIPKGPEATIPNLTEGFPLGVRTFAERYALEHGVVLRGEDAVKYLLDGLRRAAVPNGVEHAADRAPPEAIIVANALLRPALLVCNDRINEEVPNRWFGELNPRQANLQRTLKSVGLIACENLPGVAEVGTGFVVAPNVIMTNRHVAELFSTSDGKFKKHPATGKAARVTINFSVDYCTNAPRVFEIARVIHVEPEPGPDVALLEVPGLEGGGFPTLTLADAPPEPLFDRTVYVAGYPFEDWRNPWEAQRQVFGTVFGVKR
ncbi:MAG: trypsin-like peptidase domain-containing protein, partial [Planctomycetes bacterium]|nr:trypsin-like peptidase domain-containing protein [Planctomycetota bacterium]